MVRLPPRTTGTDSLLPDTTLFRSSVTGGRVRPERGMAAGLVLIAAGTFLAAAADTFTVFTVGRVIAALGGAALVPSAIGAAPVMVALSQRGRAIALVGMGFTLAMAIGSPIGTALAEIVRNSVG